MANNYYERIYDFLPATAVRSGQVDDEFDGIETAFENLPSDVTALVRGVATYGVESGSIDSYVVTTSESRASYQAGDHIVFLATHTNSAGPCTLNIDGIGAVSFVRADGAAYVGGEILNNTIIEARYDATNSRWQSVTMHLDDGQVFDLSTVSGTSSSLPTAPGTFNANLPWENINGIDLVTLGFNSDIDFSFINNVYAGKYIFQGYDSGGTIRTLATFDPENRDVEVETLNAVTNLQIGGIALASLYQASDSALSAIAALSTTDGNVIVADGGTWVAESGATAQISLGLQIGVDVQGFDAELAAIAGLSSAANKIPYFTGSGTAGMLDFLDEDTMVSDSATAAASQQSIKAYVDGLIAAATIADADYGDIVVSGAGAVWSIDSTIITTAARTVLDDATIDAMLTTLGVDDESITDLIGAMFTGNTETGITATYQDADNTVDLVVDATLADIAGLAVTDSGIIVGDGANFVLETGATARTSLGVAIGSDVQAYDADLAALAGLTSAANKVPYFTGSGIAGVLDFLDEDNMVSDSITAVATQQSVKAYVDNSVASATLSDGDYGDIVLSGSGTIWSIDSGVITTAARTVLDDATIGAMLVTLGVDDESITDLIGAMFTGNTETGITVTYQDADNTVDLVVGGLTTSNFASQNVSQWTNDSGYLATEAAEDTVGAMFTGNTETGIAATYQDVDGTIDLVVDIGGTVQGYDAGLNDIAGLAVTNSNFIVGNGTNWVAETGATARASLGVTIGSDVQAYDADLASIAALSTASYGRGLLVHASEAAFKAGVNLEIGTDVQAFDAGLTAIAGLATTNSNFIVGSGGSWVAETGATARASLGVTIGSDVQAYDANLDQIAALAVTNSNFIVGNGSAWVAEGASTARTSLGLGTAALSASTDFISAVGDDNVNGNTEWQDSQEVRLGNSADFRMMHNGTHNYFSAHVGDLYIRQSTTNRYLFDVSTGDFHADGDVIGSSTSVGSDKRFKKNIKTISNALDIVNSFSGVTFEYKDTGKKGASVIAQEVEKVFPVAISEHIPMNKRALRKYVREEAIVGLLVQAVNELTAEVRAAQ